MNDFKLSKWKEAISYGELLPFKDGIFYTIDRYGNKHYWKDGELHRLDGPAVECKDGDKWWYKDGLLHRLDGPAVEYISGRQFWYIEGVEYTEEEFKEKIKIMEFEKDPKWKSALYYGELKHHKDEIYYNVDSYGNKAYWKDGKLHRDDGPAYDSIELKEWYKEGKWHREDGPALEFPNGDKSWYIEGIKYTKEQFKEKIKIMELRKIHSGRKLYIMES